MSLGRWAMECREALWELDYAKVILCRHGVTGIPPELIEVIYNALRKATRVIMECGAGMESGGVRRACVE